MSKSTKMLVEQSLVKNKWELTNIGGITVTCSPMLKELGFLKHAFTTRCGGKSPPPNQSLNLGFNLGRHEPSQHNVLDAMENRKRLCNALACDFNKLVVPGQQHTSNIYWIEQTNDLSNEPSDLSAIDAVGTKISGQPIMLHYADCVPIILTDVNNKSVCVIHAGWRGTARKIVYKAVSYLVKKQKSNPKDLQAAIGPAIGSCCYEVDKTVVDKLKTTVNGFEAFVRKKSDKFFPDLAAINAMQLLETGVNKVDISSWCTACHPEIFYSHRQSKGKTGRQGVLACLI